MENLSFIKQVRYKPNIELYINNKKYRVKVYRAVRFEIRWGRVMNMPVPMAAVIRRGSAVAQLLGL